MTRCLHRCTSRSRSGKGGSSCDFARRGGKRESRRGIILGTDTLLSRRRTDTRSVLQLSVTERIVSLFVVQTVLSRIGCKFHRLHLYGVIDSLTRNRSLLTLKQAPKHHSTSEKFTSLRRRGRGFFLASAVVSVPANVSRTGLRHCPLVDRPGTEYDSIGSEEEIKLAFRLFDSARSSHDRVQ